MRLLTVALLVLGLQQSGPANTWTPIDLRGRNADIDGRSCHWDDRDAVVFRVGAGNHVDVNCDAASTSALLQCDPAGFEPRDATAASLCASSVLEFDPARPATIVSGAPTEVRVTWLRGIAAPQMDIRATRVLPAASPLEIRVAAPSFVRLSPAGASPRTLLSSTLTNGQGYALRTDNPGGEIFARHERAVVEPESLEVAETGRRSALAFASSWFSLPDQAPGRYVVTRVYAGGVRTGAVPVAVSAARTTDLWLAAERVGGVRISADTALCSPESGFELLPIAGLSDKPIVSTSAQRCQWKIGGLAPGLYRAHIVPDLMAGVPGDADITVSDQTWTDVQLISPPVVVRGRITVLGRPLSKREVRFTAPRSPSVTVTTDTEGRYVLGLPAAGLYDVSLEAPPLGARTYQPEFLLGENRYDLDIRGALIRVWFTQNGEKPKKPITLRVRGPRETAELVITVFDRPVDIDGLPFGAYVLTARNADGLESLDQGVTLSEKTPTTLAWLDVSRERRVLRVQTESGQPIRQATIVVSGGGALSTEAANGLYSIPPLAVRTTIYVTSPGFSPTCVIVTGANQEQATMVSRTGLVELRFPHAPGQASPVRGDLYGIPWATCPVPIDRTDALVSPHPDYDAVTLKLPIGQMQIERAGVRTMFDVPGFPVIVK